MAYSIGEKEVISYGPEELKECRVYGFEWIDNLHFLQRPETFLGNRAPDYIAIAKERFLEAGWQGDGEITLLWLAPFVFPLSLQVQPAGAVLWHVKQEEDAVSFLLSPFELPFEEFQNAS